MISLCGVNCGECEYLEQQCGGCAAIGGKVFWAHYTGSDTCPIYSCCVDKKGFAHCGECGELPCQIYFDTRDPNVSEEEHRKHVNQHVAVLKNK